MKYSEVPVRKRAFFYIILFAMIFIWTSNTFSQLGILPGSNLEDPKFAVDIAAFRSDIEDQVRLELYYKIYNDGLKFFKKGKQFVANYEMNVVVLGEDNKQLTGASVERFYRLNNYRDTRNPNDFLINLMELRTGKGKFKIICKLIDKNSDKIASIETTIDLKSLYKGENDISQIEFFREALQTDTIHSRFDKGEKRIIPSVSRIFGDESGFISLYTELYHTTEDDFPARLEFEIKDARNNNAYEDNYELIMDKPLIRFIKHIPTDSLYPGEYVIHINLTERSGRPIATTSAKFLVSWSLQSVIKNDFDLAIDQLKYVARKNEVEELKKVEPEKREEAFNTFWKEHDPTPDTPENELMDKYYGRIRHADKVFSSVHKKGWKTDMGMIFIIYGQPDHIENHPFELSEKPYQLWYYYSLSRTFGFIDEIGTGEYRLQFPYDGRRGFINDRIDDYD
jgi:GWxTD domain-containing protein